MTIQELYDTCDNINMFTKVFIMDTDRNTLVWNKMLADIFSCNLLQSEVEHYKMINDEVIIWIV